MKPIASIFMMIVVLFSLFQPGLATSSSTYASIPTFSIVSVVADTSVTIKTYNFPAHDTFTVRMGAYGTYGSGGIIVTSTDSGPGGSFVATYNIPASLKGAATIAIRLESPTSGYYAYNWFYNAVSSTSSSSATTSGYSGYPYFYIQSVVKDASVTIKTYNFPAHDSFTVRMGAYGTYGKGGTVVATTDSGTGGSFTATYNIPSGLQGSYRIAIRLESSASGYYAYNWFYNNTAPAPSPTPGPTPTPVPRYSGYPTFRIVSVVNDTTVTIKTKNFPAHDSFKVTMGVYGSLGIGGTVVATTDSGTGGSFTVTYNIPTGLKGLYRIAIRLQSPTTGYYAYNWFFNNTAVDP
jgi:hypothetical protein